MDIFQFAMQGIGAVADILSISKDAGTSLEADKAKVKTAVLKVTAPSASKPPQQKEPPAPPERQDMTEVERIAQERLADISKVRDEQDERGHQDSGQLKR